MECRVIDSTKDNIFSELIKNGHNEYLPKTAGELEALLRRKIYRTKTYLDGNNLKGADGVKYMRFNNINSLGASVGNCFEELVGRLKRIPTQKEYVDLGTELTASWWINAQLNRDYRIKGLSFDGVIVEACRERMARSYLSIINEIHTHLLLKELYPTAKIITHNVIDLVLGVDIIMELDNRRYYIHILKDSKFSIDSYYSKENHGGLFKDGNYYKYKRDFTGDILLTYTTKDSVKCITLRDIPLFRREYLKEYIDNTISNANYGDCMDKRGKLDQLNDFIFNLFKIQLDFA